MTVEEIGNNIRTMRLSRGWSQSDLAKVAKISQSSIAMYERGNRRPNDEQAEALADAFNVPKWSIFYREDEVIPIEHALAFAKTKTDRMISAGVEVMTEEEKDRALIVLRNVFPDNKYFQEG